MRKSRLVLGLLPTIVVVTWGTATTAQAVVPPGNSAVNQYTETYPRAGGDAPTGDRGATSPEDALGARNARRLEAQGVDGEAAAHLATATAPGAGGRGGPGSGAGADSTAEGAGQSAGGGSGSSGIGEVIKQATGSSPSGKMGLLLPLIIVGAVICAGVYRWRLPRRGV